MRSKPSKPKKKIASTSPEFVFLEPGPLVDGELRLALIETVQGNPKRWSGASGYAFEMRHARTGERMGYLSLRFGDHEFLVRYAGHIGYSVEPPYRGHRYAARSCLLVLPLARLHGARELWITTNPDNAASRRTCEIIGAKYIETVPVPPGNDMYDRGDREKCRYRLQL